MFKLSFSVRDLFIYGFSGIAWIMTGIERMFKGSIFLEISIIILLLFPIMIISRTFWKNRKKKETYYEEYQASKQSEYEKCSNHDDERKLHKNSGKEMDNTLFFIADVLMSFCLIVTFFKKPWIVDLNILIPFIVGGLYLLRYILSITLTKKAD